MNEFMTIKEAAVSWNITQRRVQKLCADGRIQGVQRFGKSWAIQRGYETGGWKSHYR